MWTELRCSSSSVQERDDLQIWIRISLNLFLLHAFRHSLCSIETPQSTIPLGISRRRCFTYIKVSNAIKEWYSSSLNLITQFMVFRYIEYIIHIEGVYSERAFVRKCIIKERHSQWMLRYILLWRRHRSSEIEALLHQMGMKILLWTGIQVHLPGDETRHKSRVTIASALLFN